MERRFYGQCDSVDLTEDEDSRETIADVPSVSTFQPMLTVTSTNPPPLTPIRQFTSFQNKNLNTQLVMKVPKLKKIRRPSSNSNQQIISKSPETWNGNLETVCLDSDEEEIKHDSPARNNSAENHSKITGKVLIIKKNNKYYRIIIPHNVIPTINQSKSPVLINIPGVGPINITIDQKMKEHTSASSNLEPFSLNFDDILDTVSSQPNHPPSQQSKRGMILKKSQEQSKTDTKIVKEDLLLDKRFCWTMTKSRYKNNRYSYNFRDFWGFSKAEAYRARKCFTVLQGYLHKKRCILKNKIQMHDNLKQKLRNKNSVKPVKISEIVGESVNSQVFVQRLNSSRLVVGTHKSYIPEPFQRYHIQNAQLPPNTMITQINDYDDLLLTKKVVILNGDEKEKTTRRNSKAKKTTKNKPKTNKQKSNSNNKQLQVMKPCVVQIIRDKYIEQMYKTKSKKKESIHLGIPSKETAWSIFHSKLITQQSQFAKEMCYIKPLLILNEFNFRIIDYASEFSKRNIVYCVNKQLHCPPTLLTNGEFLTAVEKGYVKLVIDDILCSFLKCEFGPNLSDIFC